MGASTHRRSDGERTKGHYPKQGGLTEGEAVRNGNDGEVSGGHEYQDLHHYVPQVAQLNRPTPPQRQPTQHEICGQHTIPSSKAHPGQAKPLWLWPESPTVSTKRSYGQRHCFLYAVPGRYMFGSEDARGEAVSSLETCATYSIGHRATWHRPDHGYERPAVATRNFGSSV